MAVQAITVELLVHSGIHLKTNLQLSNIPRVALTMFVMTANCRTFRVDRIHFKPSLEMSNIFNSPLNVLVMSGNSRTFGVHQIHFKLYLALSNISKLILVMFVMTGQLSNFMSSQKSISILIWYCQTFPNCHSHCY